MRTLSALFIPVVLLLYGCRESEQIDVDEIRERGSLVAITGYSPVSYFIYRGQPMGYEYDLLELLADHLDLQTDIILVRDLDEMIEMLNSGKADLIAYNLTITKERRDRIAFTNPLNITRQMLVQRKPENWRSMALHEIERELIRNPIELAGKNVHVRKASAYKTRLENLSREIGGEIIIVEAPSHVTTEDLIRMTAEGEIDCTVADENIARINQAYYQILDVATPVSLPQQTAWAVRFGSPRLLEAINAWLAEVQKTAEYYVIYNKYFENRRALRERYASDFFPTTGGAISAYDDLLREQAELLGWDWRMLAALIYRESQFRIRARSWAGAVGLMQLMPATALEFGAADPYDPVQNIRAGVQYLLWLREYWREIINDDAERINFILASYNVGIGHVQDARTLAALHDTNPNIWKDNVERLMLKKSNPDYYNMGEIHFGYARGEEPVLYVENVLSLYEHYKRFVE
jgi:membrane-bound lytic murein transglycosylase F